MIAILLVVAILAGTGVGYSIGTGTQRGNTSTSTTTSVSTTTISTAFVNRNVFVMNINGSLYYTDDVSSDIIVQDPGYAYFLNASITFDGVRFETLCPESYSQCPASMGNTSTQTVTAPGAAVIRLNFVFLADQTGETTGAVIGNSNYVYFLSNHFGPRAGMLVEYEWYGNPSYPSYHAFLLVSTGQPQ